MEIVVVGGGMAGSSVALLLREEGVGVTVVECLRPGATTGASTGMLAAQYEGTTKDPLFHFGLESRGQWEGFARRLEATSGARVPVRWPGLLVANLEADEHDASLRVATRHEQAGTEARVISPRDAARLQPGLTPDALSWLWLPREGCVDVRLLTACLRDALVGAGARLVCGIAVQGIVSRGGAVSGVELASGGFLKADAVVLAAGAWSRTLSCTLGFTAPHSRQPGTPSRPLRPVREQILRYPEPPVPLRRIIAGRGGRYLIPQEEGGVLAGSTAEESGFDECVTEPGRQRIEQATTRLIPAFAGLSPSDHWSGLRPVSQDGLPILGPDPDLEGLFHATGYGRKGLLLAPLGARVVADLILAGRSPVTGWSAFRPDRFRAPRAA